MINLPSLMKIAYCNSIEVLQLTDMLCSKVQDIEGDFAECGVAAGAHCVIMNEYNRPVHMFDSYQGIPMHTKEDVEWTEAHGEGDGSLVSSGITNVSLDNVKATMNRYNGHANCIFVPGWFQDTLPFFREPLALLRLDCDLYKSYVTCMHYLYPLLNVGGYIIIDDFSLSGCRRALEEYGIDLNEVKTINNGTVGYWRKG